jgi:hypothetical protein
MMNIVVEGKLCKVIEDLGYQGGYHAKMVLDGDVERCAVRHARTWRFWTAEDRLRGKISRGTGQ